MSGEYISIEKGLNYQTEVSLQVMALADVEEPASVNQKRDDLSARELGKRFRGGDVVGDLQVLLAGAIRDEKVDKAVSSWGAQSELVEACRAPRRPLEVWRLALAGRTRIMTGDLEGWERLAACETVPAHGTVKEETEETRD